ncbi:MAG: hypothetical protein H7Z76_15725 [Methylotenera sp.]|nr:hypothetical protein [Flavobacterium sp.]
MKIAFLIISALITLTSCQTDNEKTNITTEKTDSLKEKGSSSEEHIDKECDSTKFLDFKNNIQEVEYKISEEFQNEIDSIANTFIERECKEDSLYCGEIYMKDRKHYKSTSGQDLFSFAYAFRNSEKEMKEESASFFVFGIKQNDKIAFFDITDDLMGEIQLKLSGFEKNDNKSILWGEMYPYFSSEDYGKFKLTINKKEKKYEFQCKSMSK